MRTIFRFVETDFPSPCHRFLPPFSDAPHHRDGWRLLWRGAASVREVDNKVRALLLQEVCLQGRTEVCSATAVYRRDGLVRVYSVYLGVTLDDNDIVLLGHDAEFSRDVRQHWVRHAARSVDHGHDLGLGCEADSAWNDANQLRESPGRTAEDRAAFEYLADVAP